jgi:hypothetical protein
MSAFQVLKIYVSFLKFIVLGNKLFKVYVLYFSSFAFIFHIYKLPRGRQPIN